MPRSITGEQRVVASELLLKFDDVTPQGALTSTLVDALAFFLRATQLRDEAFDANSLDAATARRIAEYIQSKVDELRRKDELIPVGDIANLTTFLFPWRMKADWYHDIIYLKEGNAFVDLIARIQGLSPRTNGFNTILQQHEHSFRPTIKRVRKHYHQTVREGDHQHIWAPGQLNRTYQTIRTVQEVHSEHHHLMTVKTGGYTLEREGGALSAYSGVLVLKYMGTPVSTVRFLPDPTNIGLLAGDAIGYHIETSTAHGVHGGQGSGTSSDGYISGLSIDTQAGAGLGTITAIRSPDGTAITTAQSTVDIHYTRLQTDALIANLQSQITALQAALLQVRINGVLQPCSRLSFDSGSVSTMYTAASDHCHVWVTGPPVDSPS